MFKMPLLATAVCALFTLSFLSANLNAAEPTLKAGDSAPKLEPTGWLSGDPISEFQKGTVYVVECWATWCGPCVAVIPHVSELNTKYKDKKVEFIGLNVWERDLTKVEPFVKKMGDKMNYRVALDADKKNAEAWLTAAGRNGIPCSFIVDRDTKIAWIGHPASMEDVLEGVVAGTFNAQEHAAQEEAKKKKMADLNAKFGELLEKADAEGLRTLIKETSEDDKNLGGRVLVTAVMQLYRKKSYAAANTLAEDMVSSDDSKALNAVAWAMSSKDVPEADRNADLAIKLAEKANELEGGKSAPVLDTLAHAYFNKGDKEKAIETGKKALGLAKDKNEKKKYQAALDSFK